jgi:hypothetical protein
MFGSTCFIDCGSHDRDWVRSLRDTSHAHCEDEASNSRKRRPVKAVDVLGIRYYHPLIRVNGSDLCVVHTVGINLSTRMRIVWRRGKANINRLLGNAPSETRTAHKSTCRLPYEVVEMIIAHIARDLDTLKACSLTCRSLVHRRGPTPSPYPLPSRIVAG